MEPYCPVDRGALLELVLAQLIANEQQQPPETRPPPWQEFLALPLPHQQPLGTTTARSLHRVSQRLRTSALPALRHLCLHTYKWGQNQAHDRASSSLVPWDLLAAAPSVTGWSMDAAQLPELMQGSEQQQAIVAAAASRLKVLHVQELPDVQDPAWSHLARLLAACPLLEVLELQGDSGGSQDAEDAPCLLLAGSEAPAEHSSGDTSCTADAATSAAAPPPPPPPPPPAAAAAAAGGAGGKDVGGTSSGDLVPQGPCLPHLRELRLQSLPYPALAPWVQLRLGPHLEALGVDYCGRFLALCGTLSHFSRLRGLEVRQDPDPARPVPEDLCALTGLTRLHLHGSSAKELPQGLRSLQLTSSRLMHLGEISALQQLRELDLSCNNQLQELPDDLGTHLPALRVLRIDQWRASKQLLVALSPITRLHVRGDGGGRMPLCGQAIGTLSSLRHLDITCASINRPEGLSRLAGLEVLVLDRSRVQGTSPPPGSLAGLQQLRRLDLSQVDTSWGSLSAFLPVAASAGPHLPHLAHLDLTMGLGAAAEFPTQQLVRLGHLPRLQWLTLSCPAVAYRTGNRPTILSALAPWLAQQTALTYVSLWGNPLASGEQLQHLPTHIEVLDVSRSNLTQLPLCLTRLTGLKQLRMQNNPVEELPAWLPCLRNLELLDMEGSGGPQSRQDVLAAMPALRRVGLPTGNDWSVCTVLVQGAKHLLYGNCVPEPPSMFY